MKIQVKHYNCSPYYGLLDSQLLRFSETSETLSTQSATSQKTYVEEIPALQITRTSSLYYITFIPREELSILTANAYKINQHMLKLRIEKPISVV
jgi:hypothetical protein